MLTDEFVPLKDPVGESETDFDAAKTGSAWPAFAKRYFELSSKTVFIVPAAKGGSTLNSKHFPHLRWDSLGSLWGAAAHKVAKATAKASLPLTGIIWAQGEADASFINARELTVAEYKAQLKKLIQRFRSAFGLSLPFYIIQTGFADGEDSNGFELVQKVQKEICEELPFTYLVYSFAKYFPEYNLMTDYIHYNQKGYNSLGKTVAEVIYNIEETQSFEPPIYETVVFPNPSKAVFTLQLVNVSQEDQIKLKVLEISGAVIKQDDIKLKNEIIETVFVDLGRFSDGVYFLHIMLGEYLIVKKIHLQRGL